MSLRSGKLPFLGSEDEFLTIGLRMTPAMAAGVTDRLWDVADLVAPWEAYERRAERAA